MYCYEAFPLQGKDLEILGLILIDDQVLPYENGFWSGSTMLFAESSARKN